MGPLDPSDPEARLVAWCILVPLALAVVYAVIDDIGRWLEARTRRR